MRRFMESVINKIDVEKEVSKEDSKYVIYIMSKDGFGHITPKPISFYNDTPTSKSHVLSKVRIFATYSHMYDYSQSESVTAGEICVVNKP